MIAGFAHAPFEPVADAFEVNFRVREEIGAAFVATLDGVTVIDLWGGSTNQQGGSTWTQDTLCPIFSGTKGIVAVCMLRLIDDGDLDLDRSVSAYWPEFAANHKNSV